MDPKTEAAYRAGLTAALQAGAGILDENGSAVDAVGKATILLEDDPLFNAGRGAVFTARGENELDAALALANERFIVKVSSTLADAIEVPITLSRATKC